MKKLLFLLTAAVTVISCSKKPAFVPLPTPAPSLDDARSILLKQLSAQHLPDPYFYFSYDADRYVKQVRFADGIVVYNVEYRNKRVSKMIKITNADTLLYIYNNQQQVSRINEVNEEGKRIFSAVLQYDTAGKLFLVERYHFAGNNIGTLYRKDSLCYYPDGNLAARFRFSVDNDIPELTSTHLYSNYDHNINGYDMAVTDDFFETFLFLPQVTLQKNNAGKEQIISHDKVLDITYTYRFENGLPVEQSGLLIQLSGPQPAPAPFFFTNRFNYYP